MATLDQHSSGTWRLWFRYQGKPYHKSLKTKKLKEAQALCSRIEGHLHHLETGTLVIPEGENLWKWLLSGGKILSVRSTWTLGKLKEEYLEASRTSSKEATTLSTEQVHLKHLYGFLEPGKRLAEVSRQEAQDYVRQRVRDGVSGVTIRKELATLRGMWSWAHRLYPEEVKSSEFLSRLDYPKKQHKEPFRTRVEIEAQVGEHNYTSPLWESLFLTTQEITEILELVKNRGPSYFYPLLYLVAHTGARRSEALRVLVSDLRESELVLREKKRDKEAITFRTLSVMPSLVTLLKDWLDSDEHPRGKYLISTREDVKLREGTVAKTFERVFRRTSWQMLRGFHIFRHSFASNLALKGVDQRTIDELLGHQTEDMRRRYRHLFPEVRKKAIESLWS